MKIYSIIYCVLFRDVKFEFPVALIFRSVTNLGELDQQQAIKLTQYQCPVLNDEYSSYS